MMDVAVLGSISISAYASSLESAAPDVAPRILSIATKSVGAAAQISSELGAGGAALASAANQAFTDAMGIAFTIASAVAVAAAAVVLRYLPHRVDLLAETSALEVEAAAYPTVVQLRSPRVK